MKRRYLALFLGLALALSACGAGENAGAPGQSGPPPSQTAQLPEPSVPAAAAPGAVPAADGATETAGYSIERQDRSVHNKDGSLALSWYYDLVQLTGDTDQAQAINDSLNGHCEAFFDDNSGDLPLEKRADDLWLNTMDAADIVDSRSLEDMIFWVDSGEIVLCFSTYDLSPGACGPVIIPTGVMVEHGID